MKVILIDDEDDVRQGLKALLEMFCPEVTILGEANSVASGLELIRNTKPDLIFLDVEMTDGTGLDLIRSLEDPQFQVIFCTAHDKYALEALKLSAIDYLLKPVDPEELIKAVEKVKNSTENKAVIQTLQHNIDNQDFKNKKIILKDKHNIYIINVSDIIRCQGEGSYTTFITSNQQEITVSKNLKEYEKLLDNQFFYRVHSSHLININHISRISKLDGGCIVLSDNSEVPISKHRKDQFFELIGI